MHSLASMHASQVRTLTNYTTEAMTYTTVATTYTTVAMREYSSRFSTVGFLPTEDFYFTYVISIPCFQFPNVSCFHLLPVRCCSKSLVVITCSLLFLLRRCSLSLALPFYPLYPAARSSLFPAVHCAQLFLVLRCSLFPAVSCPRCSLFTAAHFSSLFSTFQSLALLCGSLLFPVSCNSLFPDVFCYPLFPVPRCSRD